MLARNPYAPADAGASVLIYNKEALLEHSRENPLNYARDYVDRMNEMISSVQ